jgi:hypothetical protein
MMNIILKFAAWLLHNIGVLFFIFLILIIGKFCINSFTEYKELLSEHTMLKSVSKEIDATIDASTRIATKQTIIQGEKAKKADILISGSIEAAIANLDNQLNEVDKDISLKESEKQKYSHLGEIISGKPIVEVQLLSLRLHIEKKILERKKMYLSELRAWLRGKITERDNTANLERLRNEHKLAYDNLKGKELEIDAFKKQNSLKWMVPFTNAHKLYLDLDSERDELWNKNKVADSTYKELQLKINNSQKAIYPSDLKVEKSDFDIALTPLRHRLETVTSQLKEKWLGKLMIEVTSVSSTAFQILIFIILTPLFIKTLFYFVLAPIASRRPSVCLLPDSLGNIGLEAGHSSVSQNITVDETNELLIHPEFLQSSSIEGSKDTQWLLDWQYPLTSLASNMVALTRIRTATPATFVLSATNDPFGEVGILTVPQDSAIVMQPHNLVGVRQPLGKTVRITSHWRLNSLHAWLTLQLRYLAIHGPVDLIVQGCRGVRVEKADSGRSINQAATIGFSANLSYATRRCETFSSYFLGKQELLNDVFVGDSGSYVYEEMPHFGKKTGLAGRGLEGFTDSMLKVLGI